MTAPTSPPDDTRHDDAEALRQMADMYKSPGTPITPYQLLMHLHPEGEDEHGNSDGVRRLVYLGWPRSIEVTQPNGKRKTGKRPTQYSKSRDRWAPLVKAMAGEVYRKRGLAQRAAANRTLEAGYLLDTVRRLADSIGPRLYYKRELAKEIKAVIANHTLVDRREPSQSHIRRLLLKIRRERLKKPTD